MSGISVHGAQNRKSYNGNMMKIGARAESVAMAFFQSRDSVLDIDDLRHFRQMQKADVDLSVYKVDGTNDLVEIKGDNYIKPSGNFVFEFLRINHFANPDHACTLGWTARSPAKWLVYVNLQTNVLYVIKGDNARRALQQYTHTVRPQKSAWFKQMHNINALWVSTDQGKSTLNICVPMKYLQGAYKAYDVSMFVEPETMLAAD